MTCLYVEPGVNHQSPFWRRFDRSIRRVPIVLSHRFLAEEAKRGLGEGLLSVSPGVLVVEELLLSDSITRFMRFSRCSMVL